MKSVYDFLNGVVIQARPDPHYTDIKTKEIDTMETDSGKIMEQAERLRRRADELEHLSVTVEEWESRLPADDDESDFVIFFKKRFGPSGHAYTYSAVRYWRGSEGWRWATTGPQSSTDGYTTRSFTNWLFGGEGVDELWLAIEWEEL